MPRLRALLLLSLASALACDARAAPKPQPAPPAPQEAPAKAPARAPDATPPPAAPIIAEREPVPAAPERAGRYTRLGDMEYLEVVHVPRGTPAAERPGPDAKLPMVVAIHGRGDRPENFKEALADLPVAARVILPRGLTPLGDGFQWFSMRAATPDVAALAEGMATAADRLAVLIAELQRARPTVGLPVITGFSQGGMLSFTLAVFHPELCAAAVPVGGWLPPPLWPSALPERRPLPKIVALHGEVDPAVKFGPTREAVEHLEKLGWPASLKAYPDVGHSIPPTVRREMYLQIQRALEVKL